MSLEGLFDRLDDLDPGSLLIDMMDEFQNALPVGSEYEASALRVSVETAKWSARQNPDVAVRYCRELDWNPRDLAVMMIMQCSNVSMTSGEFISTRGVLTAQGEGFRVVTEHCLRVLVENGRITQEIAEIERGELEADIRETDPVLGPSYRS
ncbi:hypothetical protein [Rhizobium sp. BG4]|uniref:hypothetical protein n=1 Tax=Rhizobium sp. BG4 TaxID=2613770 RepID=UPI00193E2CFF|nr:hypothetical protein [Rhizobium sp. BG4]QRM45837.1 hypothetical protein F2982_20650 [Rhizobium sp. BG4]